MRRLFALLALVPLTLGCSTPGVASQSDPLLKTLDTLYEAFCFDAGGEADWAAMEALFADGAAFVSPGAAHAVDAEQFLVDFREFIRTSPLGKTGFHERILKVRVDHFGSIAHAWVAFEGFVPGEVEARTRGLDSIQFVLEDEQWRLVSFTTQYEREGLPLPTRFGR